MSIVDRRPRAKYALFTVLAITLPAGAVKAQNSGSPTPVVSNVPINRPTMIGQAGVWFGPDAYPAAAIHAGEQGRVETRLSIDAKGKTVDCAIATSSGSAALDTATCAIAIEHLTFTPAWNTRGDSVPSEYPLNVNWVLPQSQPVARVSFSALSHAEITRSGVVLSCVRKVEGSDPDDIAGDDCGDLRDDPEAGEMLKAPLTGRHAVLWIQTALTIDGDKPFPDDYKTEGRFAVSYTRVHFEIASDGSILGCEKMAEAGRLAIVDLCDDYIRRFVPQRGNARRGATLSYAVSAASIDAAQSARHDARAATSQAR
jgi:TonB family protein